MIRSGSTLIEQILASHRSVFGGGERGDLIAALKSVGIDAAAPDFPESCAGFGGARLKPVGVTIIISAIPASPAAAGWALPPWSDRTSVVKRKQSFVY